MHCMLMVSCNTSLHRGTYCIRIIIIIVCLFVFLPFYPKASQPRRHKYYTHIIGFASGMGASCSRVHNEEGNTDGTSRRDGRAPSHQAHVATAVRHTSRNPLTLTSAPTIENSMPEHDPTPTEETRPQHAHTGADAIGLIAALHSNSNDSTACRGLMANHALIRSAQQQQPQFQQHNHRHHNHVIHHQCCTDAQRDDSDLDNRTPRNEQVMKTSPQRHLSEADHLQLQPHQHLPQRRNSHRNDFCANGRDRHHAEHQASCDKQRIHGASGEGHGGRPSSPIELVLHLRTTNASSTTTAESIVAPGGVRQKSKKGPSVATQWVFSFPNLEHHPHYHHPQNNDVSDGGCKRHSDTESFSSPLTPLVRRHTALSPSSATTRSDLLAAHSSAHQLTSKRHGLAAVTTTVPCPATMTAKGRGGPLVDASPGDASLVVGGEGERHPSGCSLCSAEVIDEATGAMYFHSPGTTPVVGALYDFKLPLFNEQ